MATPSEGPPSRDGLAPPDDAALGPGDMANNNTQDERERSRRLENGGDSSRPSRERSRNGSRRPSGSRVCGKCGGHLTGQFVRALGDTFHLECFTCHVSCSLALVCCAEELTYHAVGLRQDCSVQVLPRARAGAQSIPAVRD